MSQIILNQRLHVPKNLVTKIHLDAYTHKVPSPEDGSDMTLEMFQESENYYSFCRGDLDKIYKYWGDYDILDNRADIAMKYALQFTGQLRDNQVEAVDAWLEKRYGCLRAPARFGKTVSLVYLICLLKKRTLVLTHQVDLLEQFYDKFIKYTNLLDFDEPTVGFVETWEDFERYDVSLLTYQRFVTGKDGPAMLRKYANNFGFVVVDESHRANAECYSKVINQLNSLYRIGVTATPKRKDYMHCIIEEVIGPETAVGKSDQLHCTVEYIYTGFSPGKYQRFSTMENRICEDEDRNELIVKHIEERVMAGRNVIAVTTRRGHTVELSKLLNQRGITAEAFNGGTPDREGLLERARKKKTNVIIAMRKMVLGIDVPAWDTFYNLTPSANPFNYYQEFSRVRTPYKNKPTPEIFDLIDDDGACYACQNVRQKTYDEQGFEVKNPPKRRKRGSKNQISLSQLTGGTKNVEEED